MAADMALRRLYAVERAQRDLLLFAQLLNGDPNAPDDPSRSTYIIKKHHSFLARKLEAVERGEIKKLIITFPPRHGKSELTSKMFPCWFAGRNPEKSLILATYNETFALDFGRYVQSYLESSVYRQIFPDFALRTGSASAERMITNKKGMLAFVGKKGSITGRGADVFLIDDPIKDREQADSILIRNQMWQWFTQVVLTRRMTDTAAIVIIMTRWSDDDLVGRLTDPLNEHYRPSAAKGWTVIDIPAIATQQDPLGREPGEALWPERFGLRYLEEQREIDPRGFAALYQGRPTPEEGNLFKKEWISWYNPEELPANLRYYASSDHAVTKIQKRDASVLLVGGVDVRQTLWVLPETWWDRKEADAVVEAMLALMKRFRFVRWWAENGHISKALGPFLRKRMLETGTWVPVEEITPSKDKVTRSQPAQAMMSFKKVRLPRHAWWAEDAMRELLQFPNGKHDDFVDALSLICSRLTQWAAPQIGVRLRDEPAPRPGTGAWVKASSREADMRRKSHGVTAGW